MCVFGCTQRSPSGQITDRERQTKTERKRVKHFKCEHSQNSHCSQGHFSPAHHLSFPPSVLLPFFFPFPFPLDSLSPSLPPFIAFSFVSKLSPSIPYLSISLFPLSPSFSPLPLTKTVGRLTLITVRFFPPQSDTHTYTLEKCFASMPGRSKGRLYPSR